MMQALVFSLLLAAQADKTLPPIDFSRWARFVVRDLFDVQPYEKVVLMADPSYFPELVDSLRAELLEAKAIELGTILFDGEKVLERRGAVGPRAADPEYKRLTDAAMRRLYEETDLFMWLPYRYGTGSERGDWRVLEHLVEGTKARGLHFHWIQGLGSLTQPQVNELNRLYSDALDIDYGALSRHQDRIIAALKGKPLHITTPLGTDLRMQIAVDGWFHKNDGRLDRERARQARSVRDREMELPAGALRFIPDVDSVEGKLVVPSWGGGEGVSFEFRQGRVVEVSARTNPQKVLEAWKAETGDKDRVAELVVGTNSKLPARGPGRMPPYYGYGAGVLRIALGDNWESGGRNRSSMEAWFWFTDATIASGGMTLVDKGRLVLP